MLLLLLLGLAPLAQALLGSSSTPSCTIGPKCQSFLAQLTGLLTKSFTADDQIVCDINCDLKDCVTDGKSMDYCIDVLSNNSNSYISTLTTTKTSMANVLLSFQSCLNGKKTVGKAMSLKLAKPFKTTIQAKMKKMIANNKSKDERAEEACSLGISMTTGKLISEIVKKDMLLTFSDTWSECVMNKVVANGVLTIGKYIKSAYKLKAACPSG